MKETNSLHEGDVYRWYYKDHDTYVKNNTSTAYWCMDNKCVVKNGELLDTYWDGPCSLMQTSSNSKILDPDRVDLEFICNLDEIEFIKDYQVEDYDNVYNLSYQKGCYKMFAIDKGAQVSNKALRAKYSRQLEEAESNKRYAEYDIQRYTKLIDELDNSQECL